VYPAVSAEELAKRPEQPVRVELQVGAPLGDPSRAIDQHDEASVHDSLAGDRVEAEGRESRARRSSGAPGQELPVREIDAIGNHLDTGRRQTHDPAPVASGTIEAQPALEDER
jgi:hypothetical protein